MHKRFAVLILSSILTAFILTGCFDAREIDDEVYAVSIGVDKGKRERLRLTIQYPTYKGPGGVESSGGSSDQDNKKAQSDSIVHTIEAPTMLEAIDMLSTTISRRVSLIHAKWVIFSEEFAREGIEGYIAGLERFKETRPSMSIVVVRGTAEEFITENQSSIGGSLSKSIELLLSQSKFTGFFPMVKFMDFHKAMISTYRCPIALYGGLNRFEYDTDPSADKRGRKGLLPGEVFRSGTIKRELAGMAVFHGGKMIGYLDAYETAAYLLIIGKYRSGLMSIPDKYSPEHNIIFDIHKSRSPRVKAYFRDGIPVIDLALNLEAEIYAIQSETKYEQPDLSLDLENQISEYLLTSIRHTLEKTQKELKADIFGFGAHVAGNFFTIEEWEAYDWLKKFPDAVINPSVTVKVRRTGSIFQTYKKVRSMMGDKE
jgi:spore germination protein KC